MSFVSLYTPGPEAKVSVHPVSRALALLSLLCAALQAGPALAVGLPGSDEVVPRQIPYRGYLDQNGVPVTNTALPAEFDLFYTETDGKSAWHESQTLSVVDGQFTVALGDANAIPASLFAQPSLYLQITVDGQLLAGRQRLLTAPYAHAAASASYVRGQDITTWLVPSGTIMAFGGVTPPSGWLLCNGAVLSRSQYPALFAAIGTAWGAPDSGSFRIPDLRGRFLRGVDGATGNDPDAGSRGGYPGGNSGSAVGTYQANATAVNGLAVQGVGDHRHGDSGYQALWSTGSDTSRYTDGTSGEPDLLHGHEIPPAGAHTHGLQGDHETRPVNAAVTWIIKQ